MRHLHFFLFLFLSSISYAQSGITWSTPIEVANNTFGNQHPRIVADRAGKPMLIWGKFSTKEVYFSKWDSSSFTTPVALNPMGYPVFTASWAGPDIASFGDTVYVIYKITPEDTGHIFIARSFDGGLSFSPPILVDQLTDSVSRFPTITTDSVGNPLVAFMKFEMGFINAGYFVSRSDDFGNTFSPEVSSSMYLGENVCDCCPGAIVSSGMHSLVLYRDNFNDFRTIWCGISNDNGVSFPNFMQVDQTSWLYNACPSSGPDAVIIGDSVYTVFMSGVSGDAMCYMSAASISNSSASTSNPLLDTIIGISSQNFPRISNFGNKTGVVCRQNFNNDGQLAFFYTDDITTGLPGTFDTIANGSVTNTDIVITRDAVHIVWQDDNSETIKYIKGTFSTVSVPQVTSQNDLLIYPSPAKNNFTIRLKDHSKITSVEMFDASGRRVSLSTANSGVSIYCEPKNINPGIYFLSIKDSNLNPVYKKLIIN